MCRLSHVFGHVFTACPRTSLLNYGRTNPGEGADGVDVFAAQLQQDQPRHRVDHHQVLVVHQVKVRHLLRDNHSLITRLSTG